MRALTRGERQASAGVVAGLVGVLALLVSTLLLTLSYRGQLIDLKGYLEKRCEGSNVALIVNREDLERRIELYDAVITQETRNRFIDETLRAERVKVYTAAMVAAQARLDGLDPPRNCARVYASA